MCISSGTKMQNKPNKLNLLLEYSEAFLKSKSSVSESTLQLKAETSLSQTRNIASTAGKFLTKIALYLSKIRDCTIHHCIEERSINKLN